MKNSELIGVEKLRTVLSYDPLTGIVIWIVCRNGTNLGNEFGAPKKHRRTAYKFAKAFGVRLAVHRVAWALFYGSWPNGQIDHIDHDGLNNRIENLREVSNAENCRNRRRRKDNKSGFTGVTFCGSTKKWKAEIRVNGKSKYLGIFTSVADAGEARRLASIEAGFHENHGRDGQ